MTPEQFKEARRKLGLSQSKLADTLGIDPSTVRRWEMPVTNSTARPPNPIAVKVMGWMLTGVLKLDES